MRRFRGLLALVAAVSLLPTVAGAEVMKFEILTNYSQASFRSDAPLEQQKRFGFTGDNLKVKAKFSSAFTDHGMQVPELLFLKVANELQMAVDLVFVRQ